MINLTPSNLIYVRDIFPQLVLIEVRLIELQDKKKKNQFFILLKVSYQEGPLLWGVGIRLLCEALLICEKCKNKSENNHIKKKKKKNITNEIYARPTSLASRDMLQSPFLMLKNPFLILKNLFLDSKLKLRNVNSLRILSP